MVYWWVLGHIIPAQGSHQITERDTALVIMVIFTHFSFFAKTQAALPAPSVCPCTRKLDEEKSKPASLAQQNGKMVLAQYFASDAEAGDRHSKA